MGKYEFENTPWSWEECPPINPENGKLLEKYTSGIRRSMTNDFVQTIEVTESPTFGSEPIKYLQRVLFMHGSDRFKLAIVMRAHQVDEEKAAEMSKDDAAELPLVWPDGITLTVVDTVTKNAFRRFNSYSPNLGEVYDTGNKYGYVRNGDRLDEEEPSRLEEAVYDIRSGLTPGAIATEDGFKRLDEVRIITDIFSNGNLDQDANKRVSQLADRGRVKPITNFRTIINTLPYFDKILDRVVDSKTHIKRFTWDQYLEGRDASRQLGKKV